MHDLYIIPHEAELIACLINKGVNDSVSLSKEEEQFARLVADYFNGIKAYAKIKAERA